MRHLTPDERLQAMAMYQEGATSQAVGSFFGVSGAAIRQLRNKLGIERHDLSHVHRTCGVNHQAFNQLTDIMAYWVGLLMADGYVSDSGRVCLTLAEKDAATITGFRDFLRSSHRLRIKRIKNRTYIGLSIRSKELASGLAVFGVGPRKSLTARAAGGVEHLPSFWRGIMDGDGHLHDYARCPLVSLVGSVHIIRQFCDFCTPNLGGYELKCHEHSRSPGLWYAKAFGEGALRVLRQLYPADCTPVMTRKYDEARKILSTYEGRRFRILSMGETKCVPRP